MIILDTNVISEAMRPRPDEAVARWMRFAPSDELHTTAITEAEMRYGAARLPASRNRREIEAIVERIFSVRFAGRILPFDDRAAKVFPSVLLSMQKQGRTYAHSDAQIAAIAIVHGAAIATRDGYGFENSGAQLIDPWKS